jgi:hypothetical protein
MKQILYAFFLIILCTAARCQSAASVTKIEFTTLTRGYQKQIFISGDSVIAITDGRQEANTIVKRKLDPAAWDQLIKALEGVDLKELPSLPSPTSRRAFDGARHSSLKIITANGEEYQHGFDDEFPHEKLRELMDAIMNIEKGFQLR